MRSRAKVEAALEKAFLADRGSRCPRSSSRQPSCPRSPTRRGVRRRTTADGTTSRCSRTRRPTARSRRSRRPAPAPSGPGRRPRRAPAARRELPRGEADQLHVEKLMGVATNRNLKVIRDPRREVGLSARTLLAAELRLPLLAERPHPLGDVVGAQQQRLAGALALERVLELVEGRGVDRLLGRGEGERRAARQPARRSWRPAPGTPRRARRG